MRIFADKVQLADNGQIAVFQIGGPYQVQVDEFVRGTEVKVRDRGNAATDITFTVVRLHESIVAAERFMLEHAGRVPRRPKVFVMVCDFGGPRVEKKLLEPGIGIVDSSMLGCTTTHQYRVTGGKVK